MSQVGTGYIIEINLENDKNISIGNVEFSIEFYTRISKKVHFDKSEMLYHEGLYYATLDTSIVGGGDLRAEITISDPVVQWTEGLRPVILDVATGIEVGECECSFNPNANKCDCFDQGYRATFRLVNKLPTTNSVYYGITRGNITSYSEITASVFDSLMHVNITTTNKKISFGDATAGDKLIVLVPAINTTSAFKDNGFGERVPFNEDILGANGQYSLLVDGVAYRIFGEMMIINGRQYFYYGQ